MIQDLNSSRQQTPSLENMIEGLHRLRTTSRPSRYTGRERQAQSRYTGCERLVTQAVNDSRRQEPANREGKTLERAPLIPVKNGPAPGGMSTRASARPADLGTAGRQALSTTEATAYAQGAGAPVLGLCSFGPSSSAAGRQKEPSETGQGHRQDPPGTPQGQGGTPQTTKWPGVVTVRAGTPFAPAGPVWGDPDLRIRGERSKAKAEGRGQGTRSRDRRGWAQGKQQAGSSQGGPEAREIARRRACQSDFAGQVGVAGAVAREFTTS